MLGRMYEREICSAARSLEVVGERWSLLIVRNAMFAGITRFTDFQNSLGLAPNVLTKRLADLVADGVLEVRASDSGYSEYFLTKKGWGLQPVLLALTEWGDQWLAPDGKPLAYIHDDCGGRVQASVACAKCHEKPKSTSVKVRFSEWAASALAARRG